MAKVNMLNVPINTRQRGGRVTAGGNVIVP